MAARLDTVFPSPEEIKTFTTRKLLDFVIQNDLFIVIHHYANNNHSGNLFHPSVGEAQLRIYTQTKTLFEGQFTIYGPGGINECGAQICMLLSQNKITGLSLFHDDIRTYKDIFFEALETNSGLTSLGLQSIDAEDDFSSSELKKIIMALPNKPGLEVLNFNNVRFTIENALSLAKICIELPALNHLAIEACCANLSPVECKSFFKALGKSSSIRTIFLGGNIRDNDKIAISLVLKKDPRLFPALTGIAHALLFDLDLNAQNESESEQLMLACQRAQNSIHESLRIREKLKKRVDDLFDFSFRRRVRRQSQLASSSLSSLSSSLSSLSSSLSSLSSSSHLAPVVTKSESSTPFLPSKRPKRKRLEDNIENIESHYKLKLPVEDINRFLLKNSAVKTRKEIEEILSSESRACSIRAINEEDADESEFEQITHWEFGFTLKADAELFESSMRSLRFKPS